MFDFSSSHRFEVRSKYDANSLAYTTNFLPLHVDLPMLDYMPGVSMLILLLSDSCYWTVQKANRIQSSISNQPITLLKNRQSITFSLLSAF